MRFLAGSSNWTQPSTKVETSKSAFPLPSFATTREYAIVITRVTAQKKMSFTLLPILYASCIRAN